MQQLQQQQQQPDNVLAAAAAAAAAAATTATMTDDGLPQQLPFIFHYRIAVLCDVLGENKSGPETRESEWKGLKGWKVLPSHD